MIPRGTWQQKHLKMTMKHSAAFVVVKMMVMTLMILFLALIVVLVVAA
jgi:hypothetical protein